MDEPFAATDVVARRSLQQLTLETWEEGRRSVLFVTHDIEESIYLSDRILILSNYPSSIQKEIVVDLPRPRNREIRFDHRFRFYLSEIERYYREDFL